jgi:hypothetical protein
MAAALGAAFTWVLLLLTTATSTTALSACELVVSPPGDQQAPAQRRRAVGVLNGVSPQTPDASIAQLGAHMFRVPAPSPVVPRLQSLGVPSIQLILGPQILEQQVMKQRGMNISALRAACQLPHRTLECPLPGTAADPEYKMWEAALTAKLEDVARLNRTGEIVYDIWNEPNFVTAPGQGGGGWPFPSKYYTPPPGALPYQGFWEVWNRAVRLIRKQQPDAVIVGPSIAPGPGSTSNAGIVNATHAEWMDSMWGPQKAWLLEFLTQAHSNGTLPDVLSWHDYTGEPLMAVQMRSEVRAWMAEQEGMPMNIPIGFNEIVDIEHAQSAGYHIATVAALTSIGVDHAALGCWNEPGPSGAAAAAQVSTCWDGSMDGLLDPTSSGGGDGGGFGRRPKFWALEWAASLPATQLRVAPTVDAAPQCSGIAGVGGSSSSSDKDETLTLLLGRWSSSRWGTPTAAAPSQPVNITLPPSAVARQVTIGRVPGCPSLAEACPAVPKPTVKTMAELPSAEIAVTVHLKDGEAIRLSVSPSRVNSD